jgi:flagellar hook-associated protein 3 FlgL
MRITESLVFSRIRRGASDAQQRYEAASLPLMTGQKGTKPSDDPSWATEMSRLSRQVGESKSYGQTVDRLDSYFGVVESHVETAVQLLQSMTSRAIQLRNGTMSQGERTQAATEVASAIDQLNAMANATQDGRYVFAGRAESKPPFDSSGNFTGDGVGRLVPVGRGIEVPGDMAGDDVFGNQSTGNSAIGALNLFQSALLANDTTGIDDALKEIQTATSRATQAWANVGARRSELSQLTGFHEDQRIAHETEYSNVGSVDFAAAATDLKFAEDTYSATIQVAQKITEMLSKTYNF